MPALLPLLALLWPSAEVRRSWPLTGGVSAQTTAVELAELGQLRRVVVREQPGAPAKAAREFALLGVLHAAQFAVPEPLGHAPGVLVSAFVDGDSGSQTPADPRQLARFLARLHALDAAPLTFVPPLPPPDPAPDYPDESLQESRIRAALERLRPEPVPPALLHGDLWPGNTLWVDGQLAAVLDWEDAALGPPLADVGHTRLELLWSGGLAAMHDFTAEYARLTGAGLSDLPYWDLRAALRPCGRLHTWGLEPAQEAQMRWLHAEFVEQALRAVPS